MNEDDLLAVLRYSRRTEKKMLARFMVESNKIEGEAGLNPGDLEAARMFLVGPITERTLLACHRTLARHLDVPWAGRWRDCNVRVGGYVAPDHAEVPGLMRRLFRSLPKLDSWEAHNKFETIHPFEDLNGRTGRLIWLHKALDEDYAGGIPFLRKYYYQTLSRHSSRATGRKG